MWHIYRRRKQSNSQKYFSSKSKSYFPKSNNFITEELQFFDRNEDLNILVCLKLIEKHAFCLAWAFKHWVESQQHWPWRLWWRWYLWVLKWSDCLAWSPWVRLKWEQGLLAQEKDNKSRNYKSPFKIRNWVKWLNQNWSCCWYSIWRC